MGVGDFCINPTRSTLHVVGVRDSQETLDTIQYYTSCEGENPFQDPLGKNLSSESLFSYNSESVLNTTKTIDIGVTYLLQNFCPENEHLIAIYSSSQEIYSAINDIYDNIFCAPVVEQWYILMNKGLCKDIYGGIYHIWVALFFSFFFFFTLSITSSFLYQYYDLDMKEEEKREEEYKSSKEGDSDNRRENGLLQEEIELEWRNVDTTEKSPVHYWLI